MIAELGHFALILALLTALIQGVLPLWGAARGDGRLMGMAGPAALAQLLCVGVAFAALIHAYMTSDFSLLNVVKNSHSDKPMIYKISGTWGNHEGSMLLWVLILALFGAAVALFGRNLPPALKARALAVQALIAIGFHLFILLTSNPFERIMPPPANGQGLNPLLQDIGLALHPPFLYLGYVGFSMAFSFAIAALIEGRVDAAWARWVRPWTLAAWTFLTIGIVLGSWWAYYELGWGGWWYWDPVENASFMPWLAGTALLHSSIVVEKRDSLKSWTVFLAIVAFALSLLGTFLVRSGVLTSVHAFATDPARGVFILILLLVVIGGSFGLFAWRGPGLVSGGLFRPVSREGSLLLNNLLMTVATAAILLGTLYPLFIDALNLGKVSVGPPFFDAVFIPLMIPMVLAMAVGPLLAWKRAEAVKAIKRLAPAAAAGLIAAIATIALRPEGPKLAALGMALAAWLAAGTIIEFIARARAPMGLSRSSWGMTLAHLGLAVGIVGMTGASAWKVESIQTMAIGQTVRVGGYDITLTGVREVQGPNYFANRGSFKVTKGGKDIVTLEPEKRVYPIGNSARPTTETAIHSTLMGDLYTVIADPAEDGSYVTRIYDQPFVAWMWLGTAIMVLGGLLSLSDRRFRIGAPSRRAGA